MADRFRDGLDRGEGDIFRHFDLARFADRVGLRPLERLVLASSIVTAPTRKELSLQAASVIRVEFENAALALCQHPSFDHADLSPSQLSATGSDRCRASKVWHRSCGPNLAADHPSPKVGQSCLRLYRCN